MLQTKMWLFNGIPLKIQTRTAEGEVIFTAIMMRQQSLMKVYLLSRRISALLTATLMKFYKPVHWQTNFQVFILKNALLCCAQLVIIKITQCQRIKNDF